MSKQHEFIYYNISFENRNDLLSFISKQLQEKGYVTEEYEAKIIEREDKYPTGLRLDGMNIAICHADPKYAHRNTMVVAKLKEPVIFRNAENAEQLPVDLVFGLVLTNGNKHIQVLQQLSKFLLDAENLERIKSIKTEAAFKKFIKKNFGETEEK